MTTKSHKTLTGNQLHENKGVDAATDNTVATASSNATVWQKLTASHLTGTGNPFGGQLLHLQYKVTPGTSGSEGLSYGAGALTRVLNTVVTNEISGASLATNQFTLPAGTYYIDAHLPVMLGVYNSATAVLKTNLYNVTDLATILSGLNESFFNGNASYSYAPAHCVIRGRFTLSGTKTLCIQNYINGTNATPVMQSQIAGSGGTSEIYSEVMIWKVG